MRKKGVTRRLSNFLGKSRARRPSVFSTFIISGRRLQLGDGAARLVCSLAALFAVSFRIVSLILQHFA